MRIFYLVSRIPYPINKGDKLRAFHQIRLLSLENEIYLFALNSENNSTNYQIELEKYCKKIIIAKLSLFGQLFNTLLGLFSVLPLQISFFYSKRIKRQIHAEIKKINPDLIYCQLIRTSEYVKDLNYKKIIDFVDIISKGIERRLRFSNYFWRIILKIEYNRVIKYENSIFNYFDGHIIISEQDRQFFPSEKKDRICIIPNGVDTQYFSSLKLDKEYDLLFVGNMSYPPNILAAEYIIKQIVPVLVKKNIKFKLLLCGSSPGRKLQRYQSDNILIQGWVDDIRIPYSKSKIFIAPIEIGAGMQNKILEAISCKIPCITSELVNKGINMPEGSIIIASGPEDYAEKIILLLGNKELYDSLTNNAFDYINKTYNWKIISEKLNYFLKYLE